MNSKYEITVDAVEHLLPVWKKQLSDTMKKEGLAHLVLILGQEYEYVDYGVNPEADRDCSTKIRITKPDGNVLSNYYRRFVSDDTKSMTQEVEGIAYLIKNDSTRTQANRYVTSTASGRDSHPILARSMKNS